MVHVSRNAPCPCGSGKKYKRCCGAAGGNQAVNDDLGLDMLLPGHRYALERQTGRVGKLLSEQEFASVEEMDAFLQEALASGLLETVEPSSPLERAQDVMYDAWDATGRQRVALARKAVDISPDCADAYVMLAEETARTPRAARDLYAQGVAAGERALGDGAFAEYAGHFWGVLETRPYMRARLGLARTLWTLGERREAIAHYEEMLRLNPGDNQGIRYVLLNALIVLGEHDRAVELLQRYPDEMSAAWAYGRALCTFATDGATARAERELAHAKLTNPHVPAYLLSRRRLPRRLPDYYGMGDDSEAVWYESEHAESWDAVPGSHQWLEESMTASAARPPPESFTRKAHRLFLNPYEDVAFTKCPQCDQRTKVRKRYLVVHVEPGMFTVLNKSCRFCEDCDLLMVRQIELEPLLAAAVGPHYPALLGNDYQVIGTLDQKDGRQVRNSPPDTEWVLDHMSVFQEEVSFEIVWSY